MNNKIPQIKKYRRVWRQNRGKYVFSGEIFCVCFGKFFLREDGSAMVARASHSNSHRFVKETPDRKRLIGLKVNNIMAYITLSPFLLNTGL